MLLLQPLNKFMAKPADIGTKRLISLAPLDWVRWVTQITDLTVKEIVNAEFQWISRESDVLIRVTDKKGKDFLVLNELQLRYKYTMPRRMRAYIALSEEKYNLPVFPVLINILKDSNAQIPDFYESNFQGIYARQDYRVINLWEVDVAKVFDEPIPSLLPFVPILNGGDNQTTIREALRLIRTDDNLNQFEPVLGFFASFVLDSTLVQQILRWDMAILQESPWYQQLTEESEKRGQQNERLSNIRMGLETKFGANGLELMQQINEISDSERLTEILRCIMTAQTLEEVQQVL
jgi:predicted transposase YdaD